MRTPLSSIVALTALVAAAPVRAQTIATTFDELRRMVKIDETISVTDAAGTTHKGQPWSNVPMVCGMEC